MNTLNARERISTMESIKKFSLKKYIIKLMMMINMILILVIIPKEQLQAQAFAIKRWRGTYPQMNGSYPLSFIAFKGFLIPIPHFFIRTWPTHYYIELGAIPVTDAGNLAGSVKTDFLRIAERILERSQMEKRADETGQIKENNRQQRDIKLKLFDSRSDYLPDLYGITPLFVKLYKSIGNLEKQENTTVITSIFRHDADELVIRFITVNLLQSEHGKKLDAFAGIRAELTNQIGEADYTSRKIYYHQFYAQGTTANSSYAFLTR